MQIYICLSWWRFIVGNPGLKTCVTCNFFRPSTMYVLLPLWNTLLRIDMVVWVQTNVDIKNEYITLKSNGHHDTYHDTCHTIITLSIFCKIFTKTPHSWPVRLRMAGIILYVRSANERRCYIVTSSLLGWAHTQNDPSVCQNILWIQSMIYLRHCRTIFTLDHVIRRADCMLITARSQKFSQNLKETA